MEEKDIELAESEVTENNTAAEEVTPAATAVEENEQPQTETAEESEPEQVKPKTAAQKFLQFVIFALFSASAGVIQFLTQSTLYDWTHLLSYWAAYPIALTLSVIWNFTFNRKFTFKASSNVPIAMSLVVLYNVLIVVPFAILGEYLVQIWGSTYGMIVTVILLLINFATEFPWDKFIVFNDKVIRKLEKTVFKKRGKKAAAAEPSANAAAKEVAPETAPAEIAAEEAASESGDNDTPDLK